MSWNWSGWDVPIGLLTGGLGTAIHAGVSASDAAGKSLGGSLGSAYAQNQASQTQQFNQQLQDDRAWQEYMSNTSVQRAVKDIEAAGLNPWLAVNGGSALTASTGSTGGSSALVQLLGNNMNNQTKMTSKVVDVIEKLVSSAMKVVAAGVSN